MIEIEQALSLVRDHCQTLPADTRPLEQAAGHTLAQSVVSDVDSPPFDKAMMDGFAIRADDVGSVLPAESNASTFRVVGQVLAGGRFDGVVERGAAVQIMTGAPVPDGADSVVMIEQTNTISQGDTTQVEILADVRCGQNVMPRATVMADGQAVMQQGQTIRCEDIGLLAEAGVFQCPVIGRPNLSVIATGDELIPAEQKPTGSQIRNSNGPMIAALAKEYCQSVTNLGIGPDNRTDLGRLIARGLRDDVLVLSGGVSAGVADLVPSLLARAGVDQVFHKVKIKPGKPIWFGFRDNPDSGRRTLVFGLPGNPVSSMVCFRVFVAPALLAISGQDPMADYTVGQLGQDHHQTGGRTTYWPCRRTLADGRSVITPLGWKGSADLRTLAQANCFGVFPGDRDHFSKGEPIQVFAMG